MNANGKPTTPNALTFRTEIKQVDCIVPISFVGIPDYSISKTLGVEFIIAAELILDVSSMKWFFSDVVLTSKYAFC